MGAKIGVEDKTLNPREASCARSRKGSIRRTGLSPSIEFRVAEL